MIRAAAVPPALALTLAPAAAAPAGGPLQVTTALQVERRVAAPDGSVHTRLEPPTHAVPGDRVVVTVRYRNAGPAPLGNLVVTNPVPAGLAYRGGVSGSPMPEVSVDGARFAPIAALRVAGRAAAPADVVEVRWRVASPVAPGGGGQFAFQAVLK